MLKEASFKGTFDNNLPYKYSDKCRILSKKNFMYEGVFE